MEADQVIVGLNVITKGVGSPTVDCTTLKLIGRRKTTMVKSKETIGPKALKGRLCIE